MLKTESTVCISCEMKQWSLQVYSACSSFDLYKCTKWPSLLIIFVPSICYSTVEQQHAPDFLSCRLMHVHVQCNCCQILHKSVLILTSARVFLILICNSINKQDFVWLLSLKLQSVGCAFAARSLIVGNVELCLGIWVSWTCSFFPSLWLLTSANAPSGYHY